MLERKTTSLKIDPEIWKMGKKKCIDKDVSISEYIESLIKKDIKLVIFFILFISFLVFGAAFSEKVEAQDNASLNYVWNESCATNDALCWIPWFSTALGEPKIYMDLLNITAENASLVDSLLVDYIFPETQTFTYIDNITVLKDLRVLGNSYLGSFNIESDLIIGNNNLSSTYLGLNTLSPQSLLHLNLSESANSTLSNILTFERSNSSDPLQDNTGFSLLFQHIDDAGEVENISMISSIFTDVSNGSERSALSFYTGYGDGNGIISNLSSSEALRINANLSTTIFGDLAVLGNSYLGTLTFTDNGTFPDSILTDFIYPESSVDTSIENLTVLRDVHILGSLYGGSPLNVDSLAHFTSNVTFADNFTVDGSTFYVDASNNRIGIGTTTPQAMLEISNSSALSVPWLNITSGGTDAKFIIDSAGNVGIGTTAPSAPLHVSSEGTQVSGNFYRIAQFYNSSNGKGITLGYDTSGRTAVIGAQSDTGGSASDLTFWTYNGAAWGERVRIDTSGKVGIGTTSPTYILDVEVSNTNLIASFINTQTVDNSGGVLIQGGTNAGNEALNVKTSGGGQLFLVDASGETFVNTATDSGAYNLQVAGNICETDTSVSACSSDARLKENIRPLNSGLNLILSLEPKTFNFIGDSKTHAGLIAQDVQANPLTSNWVMQHDSDIYMTWDDNDYLKFSMIKAIQEQQEIIKSQEKRIKALEEAQR